MKCILLAFVALGAMGQAVAEQQQNTAEQCSALVKLHDQSHATLDWPEARRLFGLFLDYSDNATCDSSYLIPERRLDPPDSLRIFFNLESGNALFLTEGNEIFSSLKLDAAELKVLTARASLGEGALKGERAARQDRF